MTFYYVIRMKLVVRTYPTKQRPNAQQCVLNEISFRVDVVMMAQQLRHDIDTGRGPSRGTPPMITPAGKKEIIKFALCFNLSRHLPSIRFSDFPFLLTRLLGNDRNMWNIMKIIWRTCNYWLEWITLWILLETLWWLGLKI